MPVTGRRRPPMRSAHRRSKAFHAKLVIEASNPDERAEPLQDYSGLGTRQPAVRWGRDGRFLLALRRARIVSLDRSHRVVNLIWGIGVRVAATDDLVLDALAPLEVVDRGIGLQDVTRDCTQHAPRHRRSFSGLHFS